MKLLRYKIHEGFLLLISRVSRAPCIRKPWRGDSLGSGGVQQRRGVESSVPGSSTTRTGMLCRRRVQQDMLMFRSIIVVSKKIRRIVTENTV